MEKAWAGPGAVPVTALSTLDIPAGASSGQSTGIWWGAQCSLGDGGNREPRTCPKRRPRCQLWPLAAQRVKASGSRASGCLGEGNSRFVHRDAQNLKTPNAGQRKRIPGVKPARGSLGCSPCVPVSCLVFGWGQVSENPAPTQAMTRKPCRSGAGKGSLCLIYFSSQRSHLHILSHSVG